MNVYDKHGVERQTSSIGNIYGFTSREMDEESHLYYYRARYYSPDMGRFISEDPIGFDSRDFNLYRYVQNNYLNFKDPSGKVPPSLFCWSLTGCPRTIKQCYDEEDIGLGEAFSYPAMCEDEADGISDPDEDYDNIDSSEGGSCPLF